MANLALFSFFVLLSAVTMTASADIPEEVCYYNKQKCCYGWSHCGYDGKTVEEKYDCPYEKCADVCKPHCEWKEHCEDKKVGKTCKKIIEHGHHKLHCSPKIVKVCARKEYCEDVCKPHCHQSHAKCLKHLYYEYAKYCPNLHCHALEVSEGVATEPEPVVDDEAILKNTVDKGIIEGDAQPE